MTEAGANGICCSRSVARVDHTEAGEYFRCALQEEGRLALFLTDYTINGRLAWFRPDAEWQEIIADIGTSSRQSR